MRDNTSITPPKVLFDFEFAFMSGQTLYVTAEDGRDRIAIDDLRVLIQVKTTPEQLEETIVHRGALAYMRMTKREVAQEPELTEGLKLVGGAERVQ
jgi:hypothetical protein